MALGFVVLRFSLVVVVLVAVGRGGADPARVIHCIGRPKPNVATSHIFVRGPTGYFWVPDTPPYPIGVKKSKIRKFRRRLAHSMRNDLTRSC